MKDFTERNKKIGETAKKKWAALSPEEKALIAKKRSLGAKRMWARRSRAARKLIGLKISESKRGRAKSE